MMRPERGSVTVFFVILAVGFFAVVSVLAEGGRRLNNLSQAEDIAAEAARSAAATLNVDQIAEGVAAIDSEGGRARIEAEKIVSAVPNAEIEMFEANSQRVLVVVRVRGSSFVPGLDIDGVGSHVALALDPFSEGRNP